MSRFTDGYDWLMILPFRLRVCLIGLRWHRTWVWSCLDLNEWYEVKIGDSDPKSAYIEGWCRD